MSTMDTTTGDTIRRLRNKAELSQRALADLTGLSFTTISRLENGHHLPTLGSLNLIAKALKVSQSSLIERQSGKGQGR